MVRIKYNPVNIFIVIDIEKTNIPNIRLSYRHQTLTEERIMVCGLDTWNFNQNGISSQDPLASSGSGGTDAAASFNGETSQKHVIEPLLKAKSPSTAASPLLNKNQLTGESPMQRIWGAHEVAPFLELTPSVMPIDKGKE